MSTTKAGEKSQVPEATTTPQELGPDVASLKHCIAKAGQRGYTARAGNSVDTWEETKEGLGCGAVGDNRCQEGEDYGGKSKSGRQERESATRGKKTSKLKDV